MKDGAVKTLPLGDVVDVIGGGTPSKRNPAFYGGNIPWATVRDMNVEHLQATEHSITPEGLKGSSSKIIPAGEIVIATRVGLGKVCILGQDTAINQDLRGLIPKRGIEIDRRFLFYWYTSVADKVIDAGTGATVQGVKLPFVKSLPFPNLTLAEQQRIVAVLDGAYEGLSRARAHAEANLQNARELFESALGALFERDETASMQTVGALVDAGILDKPLDGNHGETHPKKADFVKSGVPFIMASDLKDGRVEQIGCHHITREQADSLRKGFAKDGDVLLSHKGTIGRTAILATDLDYVMLTPQVTYYRSTDQDKLSREYLYFAFQSGPFQKQIKEEAGGGATRAYIGITKQLDLKLPIPAIENQILLSKEARRIEASAKKALADYEAKLEDLDDLRQSILQKAFAGELT